MEIGEAKGATRIGEREKRERIKDRGWERDGDKFRSRDTGRAMEYVCKSTLAGSPFDTGPRLAAGGGPVLRKKDRRRSTSGAAGPEASGGGSQGRRLIPARATAGVTTENSAGSQEFLRERITGVLGSVTSSPTRIATNIRGFLANRLSASIPDTGKFSDYPKTPHGNLSFCTLKVYSF
ncbi:Hypothetical protein NTJ_00714 [Nesidiocoris tenuis]|uniref:Uncharacterized protein n=1 Tax=Nesidiocoris tenuis TaxID=355587 RepID=A0ABN7A7I2_9HEMI|nr:Hypothetical protein NTJ_00714 [Nesidiocoris tenuis]